MINLLRKITVKLSNDKTYYYDLDKNGKKEKIIVKKVSGETDVYKLYINDKLVLTEASYSDKNFYITDMDISDKQMEIIVITGDYVIYNFNYYTYKNNNFSKIQNLGRVFRDRYGKSLYCLHELLSFNRSGEIKLKLCLNTSNGNEHIEDYLCFRTGKFYVSNNKLKKYENWTDEGLFSKGKQKVYTSADEKKVAYTLKDEEKVTIVSVYLKGKNNYYYQIKNSKGKIGYIKTNKIYPDIGEHEYGDGF